MPVLLSASCGPVTAGHGLVSDAAEVKRSDYAGSRNAVPVGGFGIGAGATLEPAALVPAQIGRRERRCRRTAEECVGLHGGFASQQ